MFQDPAFGMNPTSSEHDSLCSLHRMGAECERDYAYAMILSVRWLPCVGSVMGLIDTLMIDLLAPSPIILIMHADG